MSFLLDLIVVGIIILCVILGYKRGLIGVAFSLASFFVAVVISLILFIPISNFVIDNTNFDENILEMLLFRTLLQKMVRQVMILQKNAVYQR